MALVEINMYAYMVKCVLHILQNFNEKKDNQLDFLNIDVGLCMKTEC
jgi:hypothetical protein